MKNITGYYREKNILFKYIAEVSPSELGSRKKLVIYSANSLSSDYYALFVIDAKSRFVSKNAQEICELFDKLVKYSGHNFKKKELLIKSPLCSKAKTFLQGQGFKVRVDFI